MNPEVQTALETALARVVQLQEAQRDADRADLTAAYGEARAEQERLREALREIAELRLDVNLQGTGTAVSQARIEMQRIARDALAPPDAGKPS